jgi:hypothetical protein
MLQGYKVDATIVTVEVGIGLTGVQVYAVPGLRNIKITG